MCGCVIEAQQIIKAKGHTYVSSVIKPSCITPGYTIHTCEDCGYFYNDAYIDAKGHSYSAVDIIAPTCTEKGYTIYKCECGDNYKDNYVSAIGHKYDNGKVTKAATASSEGTITYTCTKCSATKTAEIAKISTTVLSKTSYTYDGNEKNPTVTVKDAQGNVLTKDVDYTLSYDAGRTDVGTYDVEITYKGNYSGTDTVSFKVIRQIPSRCTAKLSATQTYYTGTVKTPGVTIKDVVNNTLKNGRDYTVTMDAGRKNVGRYAVKITYKGNYSGSQTLYFNIIPRGISKISKITSKSKGFTVQWPTQTTATTGYQVQYSTSSSFSNAKTITMPKPVYYAKSVTGLSGNKRYYVRIRTYTVTKFNGKNYNIYSPWCATKNITTKR